MIARDAICGSRCGNSAKPILSPLWFHLGSRGFCCLALGFEIGDQGFEINYMCGELVGCRDCDGIGSWIVVTVGVCPGHPLMETNGQFV